MTTEELAIYLRALQEQVQALKASARWRVGDKTIRQVERMMGRKETLLAIDHIESMISVLLNKQNATTDNHIARQTERLLPLEVNEKQHVVFLVSHSDWKNKPQGDIFTALELGEALANRYDWTYELVAEESQAAQTPNIVISMLFVRPILNNSNTRYLAWVRSYAEQWIMRPWFEHFDVILCSSHKLLAFMQSVSHLPAFLFPIATNIKRFAAGKYNSDLKSDICFSGNKWQEPRIVEELADAALSWDVKIFGSKWASVEKASKWTAGSLSYNDIPDAYASTRMVLDHSNASTTKWESVNSRVFDALGQGIPLLTNNKSGIENLFTSTVPTYHDAQTCVAEIDKILSQKNTANQFTSIQKEISAFHTYEHRAIKLNKILANAFARKHQINIITSTSNATVAHQWGDYHFAKSLANSLTLTGNKVNILLKNEWSRAQEAGSINLILRGIHQFNPPENTTNIMWIISHPNKITEDELNACDHIFVASKPFASSLKKRTSTPTSVLLQCTDPNTFYPRRIEGLPSHERLYVANSRGTMRSAVKYAVAQDVQLSIYGADWKDIAPDEYIQGDHIPNNILAHYYHTADIVINDHWSDMLADGFLSNRIFDVMACEGLIATERTDHWPSDFPKEAIIEYDENNFSSIIQDRKSKAALTHAAQYVRNNHTFDHRAASILTCIEGLQRACKSE